MEANQPAPHPANWSRGSAQRPATHLPGFCRNQRPPVLVKVTSNFGMGCRLLLLFGVLLQLSTLLLVIAGPVPPRLTPTRASSPYHPATGSAPGTATGGAAFVPPLSAR
jgi:hypothetical protein